MLKIIRSESLRDPCEINGDNPNNIYDVKPAGISGIETGKISEAKLMN
jgi:hypothetical protein